MVIFHCHVSFTRGKSILPFYPSLKPQKGKRESPRKFARKGSIIIQPPFFRGELAVRFLGSVSQTFFWCFFWSGVVKLTSNDPISSLSHAILCSSQSGCVLHDPWYIPKLVGFPHPMKHIRQRKLENHPSPKILWSHISSKKRTKKPTTSASPIQKSIHIFDGISYQLNLSEWFGTHDFPSFSTAYRWGPSSHGPRPSARPTCTKRTELNVAGGELLFVLPIKRQMDNHKNWIMKPLRVNIPKNLWLATS